jgi:hypothetical protein
VIHLDDSGAYGRLAALFARLALPAEARRVLADIPGLAAQQPLQSRRRGGATANGASGAKGLNGLSGASGSRRAAAAASTNARRVGGRAAVRGGGVRCAMIAANFEPSPGDGLLQRLVSAAAGARGRRGGAGNGGGVGATGAIFAGRNDLIVDAVSASADAAGAAWAVAAGQDAAKAASATNGRGRVPLLLFDPDPQSPGRGKADGVPAGATVVRMTGVHHTNLLTPSRAQEFLRAQLWDEDA